MKHAAKEILLKGLYVTLDLLTLVVRIATCAYRIYSNSTRPDHPLKTFLINKGCDPTVVAKLNEVDVRLRNDQDEENEGGYKLGVWEVTLNEIPLNRFTWEYLY